MATVTITIANVRTNQDHVASATLDYDDVTLNCSRVVATNPGGSITYSATDISVQPNVQIVPPTQTTQVGTFVQNLPNRKYKMFRDDEGNLMPPFAVALASP